MACTLINSPKIVKNSSKNAPVSREVSAEVRAVVAVRQPTLPRLVLVLLVEASVQRVERVRVLAVENLRVGRRRRGHGRAAAYEQQTGEHLEIVYSPSVRLFEVERQTVLL